MSAWCDHKPEEERTATVQCPHCGQKMEVLVIGDDPSEHFCAACAEGFIVQIVVKSCKNV